MTLDLETEIKVYNNLIKEQEISMTKLYLFFKTITTNGFKFVEQSKKALEEYYIGLKKENSSATHIICLTNFYNGINKYFDKMKVTFQNLDNKCANKILEFSNNFKTNITKSINNISNIDMRLKEQKINLEKAKNDYFNANKNATSQESKIIHLKESKNKKEEEFKKNNDILEKYNETLDSMKSIYLVEINKYNKFSVNYEKNYNIEVEKIYKEHEKKIVFFYEILNNFKKEINDFGDSNKDVANLIEKLNKSTNIERDVSLFKDENNFCNENNKRFILEEFLNYEVFKNSTGDKKYINNKKYKKNSHSSSIWVFGKKDGEKKINEQKVNDLIIRLLNDLDKINDDETTFLMAFVDKGISNQFKFIELLMENHKNKEFIKINSLYNFNLLSSLIQLIIDRNSNNIRSLTDKYYFLIQLSENSLYSDKESTSIKNYLCQKIYKLPLFSKKEFWIILIDTKIKNFTEEKTKAEIEKINKNVRGNMTERGNNTYYNKFKGMFTFNNNENKRVENEIMFGQKFKDNLPLYCIEVIEEYIQHFSNFNLSRDKSKAIIDEFYKKYKFDKMYYDYFMLEIKSNSNCSKYQTEIFLNNDIIEKYDKFNFNIKRKKSYSENKKLNSIAFSVSYLNLNDYKNIMILNSDYYKLLKKVIYKQILLKYPNMNIGKKITIWKIILDFSEFKKEYNYKDIKNYIIEKSENNKGRGRDVIDLDVVRTTFTENKDENQRKISCILKSIVETIPTLHYNQGMNYIAAFLLNITKDEEESFYLFIGLLTSTEYGTLFKNDLAQLKSFFYIFERLISIFLPELYTFFIDNNIKVSYFISSWFITLFTNSFQYIDVKNNPKILLKIWDSFFTDGWKTIMVTSIALLKTYESKIMIFPPEELLHFLIGDLIKENYFQNENFYKYMHSLFNFTIDDELIENLENEFKQKKKMPNLGKNLNFQII